jgi:two-component system, sensor histidine kinase and response regulator
VTVVSVRFGNRLDAGVRRTMVLAAVGLAAFLVFLVVRPAGSDFAPVDDWGVDLFELTMGALCIARYFAPSWRATDSVAKAFPLVLGAACLAWALGDLAVTFESLGGAIPPVPSVNDAFYVGFFPLCFLGFMMVIRRGSTGSLVATSLDGLIAGLGGASICAAFVLGPVRSANGETALSAATNLAYPVGDLLLLALAIGGLTILPKEYRRFLSIAAVAMVANAIGDLFNLLQPDSKFGYVADAMAWPVSLFLLAVAVWLQPADAWVSRPTAGEIRTERTPGLALPAAGTVAGLAVLLTTSLRHPDRSAVWLATATVLVAGIRLAVTVQQAQALNSARFRSLIDNAWDLIVVTEEDLEVAYTTPSLQRMLGYAAHEMQGRPVTNTIHPDDVAGAVEHLHKLTEHSQTTTFETRMRHRNGEWRTIAWTATNLLSDPSIRGYVLNGGDVTEARRAAADLAAARDGALMASKAKSDFLSTMSHEIRTPMNGVIGLTDLLLETSLDADQRELASGVKVSAENLLVIINDILDFSKIEAGKLNVEQAAFEVTNVADDVGRILAPTAHSKGLELLIDVHPDVPTSLIGDAVRIQQVLLNLASNAVKFTPRGEVLVQMSVQHSNAERVALRFEVSDTGIGIAEADQQRLFNAFAQADSSTTRRFGGTGLGLAISRQLVELMGGTLGVTSAPERGSTFWFDLSLARPENAQPLETSDPLSLHGQRVLVVDDNATNRKILRQQLSSWGLQVVDAVDGFEALQVASAAAKNGHGFDLGVIDLNMPGMDGIEVAATLKSDPATARITLFLLSSSGGRPNSAQAHLQGFAASMTKPVRPSELFDCLATNLNYAAHAVPSAQAATTTRATSAEVLGRILLVEDNTMNQIVGSKVLAKLGYAVDIANNGREALDAIRRGSYDAVLMDCQMPEMDGYEATAAIRRIEGGTAHTPVIAMTAAAMDGDREACLAAGMDDYLSKPVRPNAVAAMLDRWVAGAGAESRAPTASSDNPADAAAPTAGSPKRRSRRRATEHEVPRRPRDETPEVASASPVDHTQIELLRSLDEGAGAVLGEIIDQYLMQVADGRVELQRGLDQADAGAVHHAAHTLKGASANVGATTVAAVCADLENDGYDGRLDRMATLLYRFDTELAQVRDALDTLATRR